ncbi:MAG: hypothetical protein JO354_13280 [Verrucomicrobia bacterium]|nr:hypothetical protein [Verrucomicrobiota bacterium]
MHSPKHSPRRFAFFAGLVISSAALAIAPLARGQAAAAQGITVTAPDGPSAYGAPGSFSQSRFSPLTNAYVLPPGEIYTSLIYELDVVHYRYPDHILTQEVEVGLPYRVNLAVENGLESYGGTRQEGSFSFEARYAFADWDKIPLNPTVFAEYRIGIGHILHDEGAPTPGNKFGPEGFDQSEYQPDAVETRLLLSEEFFGRIECALNTFFEQETSGDRGREWGLAQSIVTPLVFPETLKAGVEMQFRSFSDRFSRGTPYNSFVVGPTLAWKPTPNTRLDISPLFGVNHKSPTVQGFLVFSYLFGAGGPEAGGEAPASTRNR